MPIPIPDFHTRTRTRDGFIPTEPPSKAGEGEGEGARSDGRTRTIVCILPLLLYPLTGRAIPSLGKGARGRGPRTCVSEGRVVLSESSSQDQDEGEGRVVLSESSSRDQDEGEGCVVSCHLSCCHETRTREGKQGRVGVIAR